MDTWGLWGLDIRTASRLHSRVASDDGWDEDAFWKKHEETLKFTRAQADALRYVTPEPGISMAVGPDWSGSVPKGHPRTLPVPLEEDDIRGYLSHDPDGFVNFIHTHPSLRRNGIGTALLDHAGISDTAHSDDLTSDGRKFFDGRTASSEEDDYRGQHRPPGPTTGFPLHDITTLLPEDMYQNLNYWPGDDSPGAKETHRILNKARGNPEHMVDIYRALPPGNTSFRPGDWVTTSKDYAEQHAMHPTDPDQDMPVIKSTVPAKHLWGNGDMLQEFGYHGPAIQT